ncbi:MAG: hypothetical protein HN413_15485 [Chloroflexi bacterium]|jgi:hypothetical protein|nr:hypothetical protein [Chloroflexota bacterium]
MKAKRGFIPYDGFKLFVAIVLLLMVIALGLTLPKGEVAAPAAPPAETAEVAAAETEVVPVPTEDPEPTAEPVETEAPAEDVQPTPEVELPPLPEPSEGLAYDSESGFILDADGNQLYQLNEAGSGWVPVIPDGMADMQLSSEGEYDWVLFDDSYAAQYYWDAETHGWVAVPQEEAVAEEAAPTEEAVVIAECSQASPPRLAPGGQAEVLTNVNFRSSPGIGNNWVATLLPGEKLNVVGETFCDGTYLWWQLERENSDIGWTAEAPAAGTNYFLAPVEAAP